VADKYVVYKAEDAQAGRFDNPISDAVVLRKQDLTVAPLLHAYSSMLISFIELSLRNSGITHDEEMGLRNIADWAHMEATDAEKTPRRKLPD
jgi:hypothetical protein